MNKLNKEKAVAGKKSDPVTVDAVVMCVNCEESKVFINGRCVGCGYKYDDVVPASYRDYKFDYGKEKHT